MTKSRKQSPKFQLEDDKCTRASVAIQAPETAQITLTLPVHMLAQIKSKANSCDFEFESLIKCWLYEKLVTFKSACPQSPDGNCANVSVKSSLKKLKGCVSKAKTPVKIDGMGRVAKHRALDRMSTLGNAKSISLTDL